MGCDVGWALLGALFEAEAPVKDGLAEAGLVKDTLAELVPFEPAQPVASMMTTASPSTGLAVFNQVPFHAGPNQRQGSPMPPSNPERLRFVPAVPLDPSA